jgi:uncharacterized membrane protein YqjE
MNLHFCMLVLHFFIVSAINSLFVLILYKIMPNCRLYRVYIHNGTNVTAYSEITMIYHLAKERSSLHGLVIWAFI